MTPQTPFSSDQVSFPTGSHELFVSDYHQSVEVQERIPNVQYFK